MKSFTVNVPDPCSEDWQHMKPSGCGRFCGSCAKTVVDFTTFSDEAFIAYFSKQPVNTCGRFSPHQLALEVPLPYKRQRAIPGTLHKAFRYAALSLFPLTLPVLNLAAGTTDNHSCC